MNKHCIRCKEPKDGSEFDTDCTSRDGLRSKCKSCCVSDKEDLSFYQIKKKYDLSKDEYKAILADQKGVCAVCGGGPNGRGSKLYVDHCHKTNKVRGLLCRKCNLAIGYVDDDYIRAAELSSYLHQHTFFGKPMRHTEFVDEMKRQYQKKYPELRRSYEEGYEKAVFDLTQGAAGFESVPQPYYDKK